MKTIKKIFVLLVVLSMVFGTSLYASASNETTVQSAERVKEVVELRESNSKTYQLADGAYQYVGYAEDIHYMDNGGALIDISNNVVFENKRIANTDYKYKNEANSYTVRFGDNVSHDYPIIMEYQDKSVAFDFVEGKDSTANKVVIPKKNILSDTIDMDSCIIYNDVFNGIDIMYEAETYGIKEYIILNQPTSKNEFYFSLQLNGLKVREDDKGVVIFVDDRDEVIFTTGQLFAIDNNEVITDNVKCDIIENNGSYQLKITIDKEYLADTKRAYPIIIDPSVMISGSSNTFDSFVGSKSPNTNYNSGSNMDYLRTGRDSYYYTRRTYIKFDLPTNIASRNVTSAYLRMRKSSGATPSVKAYRVLSSWNSSSITWNNKPSYTSTYASGTAWYDGNSWYKTNVTTLVKKWLNNVYSNYGFMVKDATESGTSQWTTFYSSDAPSPNKPELIINYTLPSANYVSIRKATDRTFRAEYPSYTTKINNYISAIDDPFIATWNINFTHYAWRSFTTLPAYDCSYAHNVQCNGGCGNSGSCGTRCVNDTSTPNHHKNHYRNFYLAENGVGSADIQLTFFGFNPCSAGGLTRGDYSTIACPDGVFTETYIKRTIQHEISHLFGCTCGGGQCSGQDCIMSGGFDYKPFGQTDIWCENCEGDFNRTAH